jgi:hypothetical protein
LTLSPLDLAEVEKQVYLSYSKIANTLATALLVGGNSNTLSNPTSPMARNHHHAWLGPLQSHALRCATDGETFGKFIRETVLSQLEKIREDLKVRGRDIKQRLADAQAKLYKQHEGMSGAMSAHERAWALRMRLYATGSGVEEAALAEALGMTDVFISEQQLRFRITQFLGEKTTFCAILMELFAQAQRLEHDMATSLKDILGESMRVKGQQLAAAAEQLSDCANVTRNSETLVEWHTALKRCRLDWEWQVDVPPLDGFTASVLTQIGCALSTNFVAEVGALVRPVKVLKSGFLMARLSTFGRSWSVIYCVLVDSAWLHCYLAEEPKNGSRKAGSTDGVESGGGTSPYGTKSYRVPSPSMRLYAKALADLNSIAARHWLAGELQSKSSSTESASVGSGFYPERFVQPALSIPLLHAETTIVPESGKTGEHCFAIIVPGGSSFFSRSERKYVLRSFVEEDMVDWCIAFKEMVGGGPDMPKNVQVVKHVESQREQQPITRYNDLPFGSTADLDQSEREEEEEEEEEEVEDLFESTVFRERAQLADEKGKGNFSSATQRPSTPTSPIQELENPWDQ